MTEPAPDRTGDGAGPPGPNGSSNRDQGMRILSYLMAGIGLYGNAFCRWQGLERYGNRPPSTSPTH